MTDYNTYSIEELDFVITDLSNQRDVLQAEALAATAAYDRIVGQKTAESLLDKLSTSEFDALVQAVETRGIATEEATPTIGEGTN